MSIYNVRAATLTVRSSFGTRRQVREKAFSTFRRHCR